MFVAFRANRSNAFADWSSSAGTVWGTIPCDAGNKNELATARANAITASSQIAARPEIRSTAAIAWATPATRFDPTMTR